MKKIQTLMLAGSMVALSACSGYESFSEVEALNEAQAVGSPFTQSLAGEYREYSNSELKQMFDYPDALHFARKGLAAAAGETVLPEPVTDWNLLPEHIEELGSARGRLMVAFDLGARETEPALSAKAQAKFDCWIEQQEENWQAKDIGACKSQFMDALAQLESKLGSLQPPPAMEEPMAPIEPVAEAAPPMAPEDAMYLVFFDWDKATIGPGGQDVINAVADEIMKRKDTLKKVNIVGHADTSGPDTYNDKLSLRRANAVRDALIKRGVDAAVLNVASRGETEPLVQTADNVREPANRRANISFE